MVNIKLILNSLLSPASGEVMTTTALSYEWEFWLFDFERKLKTETHKQNKQTNKTYWRDEQGPILSISKDKVVEDCWLLNRIFMH